MFCRQINKSLPSEYNCNADQNNKPPKSEQVNGDNDGDKTENDHLKTDDDEKNEDNAENKDVEEDDKNDDLIVSDSIAERIENGIVTEDRLTCYDDNWLEKIATMDKAHAEEKLNVVKAEEILTKLSAYTHYKTCDPCGTDAMQLLQCYAMFEGQSIRCGDYVKNFVQCVDKSFEDAVNKPEALSKVDYKKKMTYMERFEKSL